MATKKQPALTDQSAPVRRLPKHIATLTLAAPYDDFHVTCWVNAPRSLWLAITAVGNGEASVAAALQQIVIGHDLVDFDGLPYPQGDGFWEAIPTEVGIFIIQALIAEVNQVPKPNAAP